MIGKLNQKSGLKTTILKSLIYSSFYPIKKRIDFDLEIGKGRVYQRSNNLVFKKHRFV